MFSSIIVSAALTLLLAQFSLSQKTGGGPCLIYGPDFPAPLRPSTDPSIVAAIKKVKDVLANGSGPKGLYGPIDANRAAFSIDIFSTHEADPIWTYHNTPPPLRNGTVGTKEVDSDSIYRIGSIGKMVTVYLYLLEVGDASWNRPITDFIPELAEAAAVTPANQIDKVDWESITPGALASQLAGLGRLDTQSAANDALYGLPDHWPPAQGFEGKLCGIDGYFNIPCNRSQFFESFLERPPVVPAFQTAIYSNTAFTLLGYALESITNKTLEDIFQTALVDRHDLNATTFTAPPFLDSAVIPMSLNFSHFTDNILNGAAFGGYYSSISDFRKIGRAILNSTHLSPALTRRWLKPHAFNADPNGAIGAPFEMLRAPSMHKLSWIYTKAGDYGDYSTIVAYMPEYDVGFTVFTAWTDGMSPLASSDIGNLLLDVLPPALEKAARREAGTTYAGTYKDEATNSSMVVGTDGFGGMDLVSWIQNSTDVRGTYLTDYGLDLATAFARLVPTGLKTAEDGITKAVNFRLLVSKPVRDIATQVVTSLCFFWVQVDALTYGRYGIDSVTFEMGADGEAVAVTAPALGTRMVRVG